MNDEVARWATSRAPDLLARAEEQALAYLTRALIEAALDERGRSESGSTRSADSGRSTRAPRPEPEASGSAGAPAARGTGHGLWVYCVAAADAELPVGGDGVEPDGSLERIEHAGLAALVSRVPLAHYSEDALRQNLNDLEWLERVARAHEAILEKALATSVIVPLRLCTIYEDREGVVGALASEHESFSAALDALEGRQEWGVKMLVDRSVLEAATRASSDEVAALEREVAATAGGGAYMMSRRLAREVRALTDRRLQQLVDDVDARLRDWADDAVQNSPQNRDLSSHEGEMVLNGAYLIETGKIGGFRELVEELDAHCGELGASLELTGPWPPYNFVPPGRPARGSTRA